MAEAKLGRRYAKSLFDLAMEQGKLEVIYNDMVLIDKVCKENRDLVLLLQNPIIFPDKKISILKEIFSAKVEKLTIQFLEIIVKKRRENHLIAITTEYIASYMLYKGIEKAIVTSAVGLDDKLRAEIIALVKKLHQKEVELVEKIDKKLLGGFILQVGDKQYDASISRSLKKLSREFINNPYVRKN